MGFYTLWSALHVQEETVCKIFIWDGVTGKVHFLFYLLLTHDKFTETFYNVASKEQERILKGSQRFRHDDDMMSQIYTYIC